MKQIKTALLVVAIFFITFLVNTALDGINLQSYSVAATRPCSVKHVCLKNHNYGTYCTGNTGDFQQGYTIVPCPNSTVVATGTASGTQGSSKDSNNLTPQSKNTPVVSATSTITSQATQTAQNQASTSNNGNIDTGLQTVLQKLGPYYPNPNTVATMQERLKLARQATDGHFKAFKVNVVIDLYTVNNSAIVATVACYVQCTSQLSSDSTSVYGIITSGNTVYQPLILINDASNVQIDLKQDYIAVSELASRGHFYLMVD